MKLCATDGCVFPATTKYCPMCWERDRVPDAQEANA